MPTSDSSKSLLKAAILAATKEKGESNMAAFQIREFFPRWFRQGDNAYFFVFKKNLSITNIQYAELYALLRGYTSLNGGSLSGLQFHTTQEFTQTLEDLTVHIKPCYQRRPDDTAESEANNRAEVDAERDGSVSVLIENYWPLFERSIVVTACFGSCAIFMAPCLQVDLARVCGESGYLYACGRNLFFRNVQKAKRQHLWDALREFTRQSDAGRKIPLIIYSSEEFPSKSDRDDPIRPHGKEDYLENGLDELKIRIDKSFLDGEPLGVVLRDIASNFPNIDVARPGVDYRIAHTINHETSLWLVADRLAEFEPEARPGERRYYILYEQLFINGNPFHIFDENKPGWVAHTTIPHKLYGAMINITKPWPRDRKEIILCDPFAGTATAHFETLNHERLRCVGGDTNLDLKQVFADNLKFFALQTPVIKRIADRLRTLANAAQSTGVGNRELFDNSNGLLLDRLKARINDDVNTQGSVFDSETRQLKSEASENEYFERVALYVGLRAKVRYGTAMARGSMNWSDGVAVAAEELALLMHGYAAWKERHRQQDQVGERLGRTLDQFSLSCSVLVGFLESELRQEELFNSFAKLDALDTPSKSCFLLITDPPYGFNTNEDDQVLTNMYRAVIPVLVKAVENNGHLVICLPEQSFIGKHFPPCTNPGLITSQVLIAADEAGREIYNEGRSFPSPRLFYMAPYYWSSGTALRRKILHFRVRDRVHS